jgi:hypothetical protein
MSKQYLLYASELYRTIDKLLHDPLAEFLTQLGHPFWAWLSVSCYVPRQDKVSVGYVLIQGALRHDSLAGSHVRATRDRLNDIATSSAQRKPNVGCLSLGAS